MPAWLLPALKIGGSLVGGYLANRNGGRNSRAPGVSNATRTESNNALNQLRQGFQNPNTPQLRNDPTQGVQYSAPAQRQFDTNYFDRASGMQRPGAGIQNDAAEEARGMGQFSFRDRAPANRANDPWQEIRDFRGEQGDFAKQFASGGYPGGGSGSGGGRPQFNPLQASASTVNAMKERADVSELMSFDPSSAFERYMTGAQSRMANTLDSSNKNLTNTAAGGNRLNTGFFDLDAGELGRQVRQDFSNDLSARALDTNAQRLSAITAGSNIRASDLDSLRGQDLQAQMGNQRSSLEASIANQRGQESAWDFQNRAADRDADFRLKGLDMMGQSDNRRLDALSRSRDYMDRDEDNQNDLFDRDRDFGFESFRDRRNALERHGVTQRDDRGFANDNFDRDRDWLTDMGGRTRDWFEGDRDHDMDRWERENDNRFRGGDVVRQDRDWEAGFRDREQNRYLDWLSGTMDREQGASNAQAQANAQRSAGNNQFWGQVIGAGVGYAANRWGGGGGGGVRGGGGGGGGTRYSVEDWEDGGM